MTKAPGSSAEIVARAGMPASTPQTMTTLTDLLLSLRELRERGYAVPRLRASAAGIGSAP